MNCTRFLVRSLASAAVLAGLAAGPAGAVDITFYNADSAGEGFNSNSPRAAIGGNSGTSLGAQRRFVMEYAADVWAMRLDGDLPVIFTAKFDSMGGDAESATLGFAAPVTLHKDFLHAPKVLTWYMAALANQFYGTDLNDLVPASCPAAALPLVNGKCPDLRARFNSDVDGAVLGGIDFYYGIDGKSGGDIDFLSVVLHEMAHGMGLLDLIDPVTGRISPNPAQDNCQNCSDAYTENLEDPNFSPRQLSDMTNSQRLQAIVDTGKVFFTGDMLKDVSFKLAAGRRGTDGAVQIFAPDEYEDGSSIGHLSTAVSPNELMEPRVFNPPQRNLRITLAMFADVGWELEDVPDCGDPNFDFGVTTSDALIVLKVAVGAGSCAGYVCNVNFAGGINTTDALILLKYAVGQGVSLVCPLA